jgi:SAM-dependent methyltransferase
VNDSPETGRNRDGLDELLAEQISYYRARAPEYEAGALAVYEDGALAIPGGDELDAALDSFRPTGSVLELACGTGRWTERLLRHADSVTAIDASPEMLTIASSRIGGDQRARFVQADLFRWRPDRLHDVVFFGFWLSHVPLERFGSFWSLVAECLTPGGRVFFVDDAYRTPDELSEGESSSTVRRRLEDGTAFRAVKVPHTPVELERRLTELGWRIEVHQTSGRLFWGSGCVA